MENSPDPTSCTLRLIPVPRITSTESHGGQDDGLQNMNVLGECKSFKEKFMKCLRDNNFENALCRNESKEYLECRMERQAMDTGFWSSVDFTGQHSKQLMAQEPLEKLGFGDLIDGKSETKTEP
ncbi:Cytochrome c oxidase assembly protein COX19 [Camelus dromedarius]|uniref:Cytochrome c oxidase assembly protein COX19 n=1 Tax=Camelus dromedarius TaxID=9838 RepID=A0A5N4CXD8_CAMDR|nr:Cytochrome c oxidase assembly protein COX19 [Camelus dromedarius]